MNRQWEEDHGRPPTMPHPETIGDEDNESS